MRFYTRGERRFPVPRFTYGRGAVRARCGKTNWPTWGTPFNPFRDPPDWFDHPSYDPKTKTFYAEPYPYWKPKDDDPDIAAIRANGWTVDVLGPEHSVYGRGLEDDSCYVVRMVEGRA